MEENQTSTETSASKNSMMPVILIIIVLAVAAGGYFLATRNSPQQNTAPATQETMEADDSVVADDTDAMMADDANSIDSDDGEDFEEDTVKEFTVNGSSFSFDPTEITVKKGDTVRIVFNNEEGFHDWVLDEFNAKTQQLQAGQSETIEFVADQAGSFEYYCSVGEHRAQGMVGTLVVEE